MLSQPGDVSGNCLGPGNAKQHGIPCGSGSLMNRWTSWGESLSLTLQVVHINSYHKLVAFRSLAKTLVFRGYKPPRKLYFVKKVPHQMPLVKQWLFTGAHFSDWMCCQQQLRHNDCFPMNIRKWSKNGIPNHATNGPPQKPKRMVLRMSEWWKYWTYLTYPFSFVSLSTPKTTYPFLLRPRSIVPQLGHEKNNHVFIMICTHYISSLTIYNPLVITIYWQLYELYG